MNWLIIDDIIKNALQEDISSEDISTVSTVPENSISTVDLIAKEEGVIAGLSVFKRVFEILGGVEVNLLKKDGDLVQPGMLLADIQGTTRKLLSGERVALNFLQRMSGIATLTSKFVNEIKGTNAKLLDTRKTTPGLRILEKYSVKIGGGENHRFNLSDGIMLKDNHIAAAGGLKNAVSFARSSCSFVRKIEVEVENIDMLLDALEADADIIMLDNMSVSAMKEAVKIVGYKALTEASGNITLENIHTVAETGVDYISVGALTHSYKVLDLSMKNLRNV